MVFVDSAICSIICKEGKGGIASQFSAFELSHPHACSSACHSQSPEYFTAWSQMMKPWGTIMKDNPEWTSCFNLCVLVFGQKSLCSWIHMCVITFFFYKHWMESSRGWCRLCFFPPALLQADTNLQECPVWAAVHFPLHLEKRSSLCGVTLRFWSVDFSQFFLKCPSTSF